MGGGDSERGGIDTGDIERGAVGRGDIDKDEGEETDAELVGSGRGEGGEGERAAT